MNIKRDLERKIKERESKSKKFKDNYVKRVCKKKTGVDNKCEECNYWGVVKYSFERIDNQLYGIKTRDCIRLKHICPFCHSFIPFKSFLKIRKKGKKVEGSTRKEDIECKLCSGKFKHVDLLHFDIYNIPEEISEFEEPKFDLHKLEDLPEHTIKGYKLPRKGWALSITKFSHPYDPKTNLKFKVLDDDFSLLKDVLGKISTKEYIIDKIMAEHKKELLHVNIDENEE